MIEEYPAFGEIRLEMRPLLHPLFQALGDGVSEFTFANLYLFRHAHGYRISRLEGGKTGGRKALHVIAGSDEGRRFFMLPFGIPREDILEELLRRFGEMKAVSEPQAGTLRAMGLAVEEDRDNYDYLYLKSDLAGLAGRAFHKKKNMVNAFINNYSYEGRPLLEEYVPKALGVLEEWRASRGEEGDYRAAKEALENTETLSLCGGIYFVDGRPAGYTLGEEIASGTTYLIQFEKAVPGYKGLYQFINMSFAGILPDKYVYINREQDLGDEGLRQAKTSYRPCGFIKKFRAFGRAAP